MAPPKPTHLIICCCHNIYHPQANPSNPAPQNLNLTNTTPGTSPSDWLLAPFQKDEQTTFLEHARKSIILLASTPDSLLVFSGGFTDQNVQASEAASYFRLCEDNNFWGKGNEGEGEVGSEGLKERIILEERALDSLQNLLFSILAFWRKVGEWPERITIISMHFKERRFMELHIPILGFSPSIVNFIGINPEYMSPGDLTYDEERTKEVIEGERIRGYEVWKGDMLGVGDVLREKRIGRDSWGTRGIWFESEAERARSGVRSEVRVFEGVEEEMLVEGFQPWGV